MFDRMVIGFRAEASARSALAWAIDQAAPGALIDLVQVADDPGLDPAALPPAVLRARAELYAAAARLGSLHPELHVRGVFAVGSAERLLAARSGPDTLLVLGARESPRSRHALLASRLVTGPDRSVAIVPSTRPTGPVFVGMAPSTAPEVALVGADIAASTDSELILLRAEGIDGTGRATPTELVARIRSAHPELPLKVLLTTTSAASALERAGEQASVLIVGPHLARSGVRETVLTRTPCPLLMLGAGLAASAGRAPVRSARAEVVGAR
jgi:hypothetical protein